MITKIDGLPAGCDGLRAQGKVTREDYQQVFEPLFEQARQEGRRIRLLYQLGSDFEGFTPGAAWEDMRVGLHYLRLFERCAMVSDVSWVRESSRFMGVFMPCPVRVFANGEWDEAIQWLATSAPPSGLTHRLLADVGVLLVEPHGPLRAEDFESIAMTVDPWIEAKGSLHGLVIHASRFPGWESFGAFTRHLRFLSNYHHKVQRVALAADGTMAELVPKLGSHFAHAEVKHFDYDQVDQALAWASAPAAAVLTP